MENEPQSAQGHRVKISGAYAAMLAAPMPRSEIRLAKFEQRDDGALSQIGTTARFQLGTTRKPYGPQAR